MIAMSFACLLCSITVTQPNALLPPKVEDKPDQEVTWRGRDRGLFTWGSGGDFVYGVSGKPMVLDVLRWTRGRVEKAEEVVVEGAYGPVVPIATGKHVMHLADPSILLMTSKPRVATRSWPYKEGWSLADIELSRNGAFVVLALDEDAARAPADYDFNRPRVLLGILKVATEQLSWIPAVRRPDRDGETIRKTAVSDDGGLIAIAGWGSGVAVVSVREKQLLWGMRPKEEVGTSDVAFSPDGKVIYCGGGIGQVYKMDSGTGRIINTWWANHDERPVYGQRITSIAASGDGRFVAAGTGPEGLVYVATADARKVRVFKHGTTILTMGFSPDSKHLATVAGGKVKIWAMP